MSLRNRAHLVDTLTLVFDPIMPKCDRIEYRLVGSAAALLRGVELPANDAVILNS
jgi:hypothetical protein